VSFTPKKFSRRGAKRLGGPRPKEQTPEDPSAPEEATELSPRGQKTFGRKTGKKETCHNRKKTTARAPKEKNSLAGKGHCAATSGSIGLKATEARKVVKKKVTNTKEETSQKN